MVVAGGSGSWFWDEAGKRYLDFSSQLVNLNLGHQHPAIVKAIAGEGRPALHDLAGLRGAEPQPRGRADRGLRAGRPE